MRVRSLWFIGVWVHSAYLLFHGRAAGDAAFKWDGLTDQVQLWNDQLDQLPQQIEGNQAFLAALQKTLVRPQKCTVPGLSG